MPLLGSIDALAFLALLLGVTKVRIDLDTGSIAEVLTGVNFPAWPAAVLARNGAGVVEDGEFASAFPLEAALSLFVCPFLIVKAGIPGVCSVAVVPAVVRPPVVAVDVFAPLDFPFVVVFVFVVDVVVDVDVVLAEAVAVV